MKKWRDALTLALRQNNLRVMHKKKQQQKLCVSSNILPCTFPEASSTRILETLALTRTFPPAFSITGMMWKAISLAPPRG